jgi:hypothetical protein
MLNKGATVGVATEGARSKKQGAGSKKQEARSEKQGNSEEGAGSLFDSPSNFIFVPYP